VLSSAANQGPIEVILKEELTEPLLSACHAKVAGRVRVFVLERIVTTV
jgi:hypothetical protein